MTEHTAEHTDANSRLLAEIGPVVRAILMKKSGMSLAPDDTRLDNVDAFELYHDVIARLWERLAESASDAPPDIRDFKGYAASVAYNAWSDHLRARYPQRASLKNRLRYFLGHQARYALWENPEGDLLAGLKKWQLGAASVSSARIAALREQRDRLPRGSVPRKPMERFTAQDWDQLLASLFAQTGGPVALDDLVAIVAVLIGLKEDRVESIDAMADEDAPARELVDEAGSRPDREAEMRDTLVRLWAAIMVLKPDYRAAYLLNIPGPGKSRGDIEVFVIQGVTTIGEIGASLALTEGQYAGLWPSLDLSLEDRQELAQLIAEEWFYMLWKYLPLADGQIAQLLGLVPQQVINRRMLAVRELGRALTAAFASRNSSQR